MEKPDDHKQDQERQKSGNHNISKRYFVKNGKRYAASCIPGVV
ncbi:hypothetical protein ACFWMP_31270 [Paenibacillus sp. NPDC058367]